MKANHFILLLTLGLLSFPVYSDAQQPFLVKPDSILNGSETSIVVRIPITDSTSLATESRNLINLLISEGYFNSKIDSIRGKDEIQTELFFSKGPRSTFYRIIDLDGSSLCESLIGSFFSSIALSECMNTLMDSFNRSGRPFATISLSDINNQVENEVSVTLNVDTGDLVTISNIRYIGNNYLSDSVLKEISGWKDNEIFSPVFIDESLSRLNRSVYISDARFNGFSKSDSLYNIIFSIDEVRSSTIDLILGLEPKVDGNYRLIGQGNLTLNHLFTAASSLNIHFNRSGTAQSGLDLLYDQFQISRFPFGYSLGVELRQIDSTYLSIASLTSASWRVNTNKSLNVGFKYNRVSNSDSIQNLNQLNQSRREFSLGFTFNSLNNWRVPTYGSTFMAKLSSGFVNITDDNIDDTQSRGYSISSLELKYSRYLPIRNRLVIVPTQSFIHTVQDRYFDIDKARFGGTHSMRGFREEQFRLAGYSMTSVEGRWMLDSTSYLFTFVSGAYIWTPDKLGTTDYNLDYDRIYSSGFGISYKVRPGIFNISYAISSDDSWINGKIHFGITNSF